MAEDDNDDKKIIILYPISFHTDTMIKAGSAKFESYNQFILICKTWFNNPILGSNIQAQIIPITTIGVIKGRK